METIFYSRIIPDELQPNEPRLTFLDVIRRAHALGYELVQFKGYDEQDCRDALKGHRPDIIENKRRAFELRGSFGPGNGPRIIYTIERSEVEPMDDDEATNMVRAVMGETGGDL